MFSYDLIDSEETRAIYKQMLDDDVAKVLAWRAAGAQRQHLPIEGAFGAWWFTHGPTRFKTGADAVRYRGELLERVQRKLAEVVTVPENVTLITKDRNESGQDDTGV